jgi:hypothetical protein
MIELKSSECFDICSERVNRLAHFPLIFSEEFRMAFKVDKIPFFSENSFRICDKNREDIDLGFPALDLDRIDFITLLADLCTLIQHQVYNYFYGDLYRQVKEGFQHKQDQISITKSAYMKFLPPLHMVDLPFEIFPSYKYTNLAYKLERRLAVMLPNVLHFNLKLPEGILNFREDKELNEDYSVGTVSYMHVIADTLFPLIFQYGNQELEKLMKYLIDGFKKHGYEKYLMKKEEVK